MQHGGSDALHLQNSTPLADDHVERSSGDRVAASQVRRVRRGRDGSQHRSDDQDPLDGALADQLAELADQHDGRVDSEFDLRRERLEVPV
jgi:hypothetical protein